jgi:hypothetical protein
MNDACKQIEPLLYLFREDELSPDDRARVASHCRTCASCAGILEQLTSLDAHVAQLRLETPQASGEESIIDGALQEITGEARNPRRRRLSPQLEGVVAWLRPTFGTLLIFAAMTLAFELSRDAISLHRLETRLASKYTPPGALIEPEELSVADLLELAGFLQARQSTFPPQMEALPAAAEPYGPALQDALRQRGGLIDKFEREYPRLFSVNPNDGISDEERSILASDGKKFVIEFETYIRTGVNQ